MNTSTALNSVLREFFHNVPENWDVTKLWPAGWLFPPRLFVVAKHKLNQNLPAESPRMLKLTDSAEQDAQT